MASPLTVYCDEASDELLAEQWLVGGEGLGSPIIARLPSLSAATPALRPILEWERQDWVLVRDGQAVCTVEFSRHGYTGDNGFQRFARLYRAAELGIPNIYFTPFSRSRLNELDEGLANERNVAPELFQTLANMSERFNVPCLALAWPTDDEGTPLPLTTPPAAAALEILRRVIVCFVDGGNPGANASLRARFPEVLAPMDTQAALGFRGSETRGVVDLPRDLLDRCWVEEFLPERYFQYGKADKALASLALNLVERRSLESGSSGSPFWELEGRSRVLFLGYQWRPDPSSGLIALTAAQRRDGERLVVVWPRVFLANGAEREAALGALREFKSSGGGPLRSELERLGFGADSIQRFRERVSVTANQFGVYTPRSKPARILRDTGALVVLGDGAVLYG